MLAIVEAALGAVGIGVGKRSADGFESNAIVAELQGVQFDAHSGLCAAADKDLADALDLRDLLGQYGVGHVVHLRLGYHVGSKSENEDRRVGGIGLAVARDSRQVCGQLAPGSVDGRLYVPRRGIDVAIEIKLKRDVGRTKRTGRRHLVDAGDAAELAFKRGGNS